MTYPLCGTLTGERMFEGFDKDRVVDVGGIDIAYVIGGSGPAVLLLHGYPQTKEMWAKVAPELAKEFTVVCADLRGYGSSGKPHCLPDNSNYSFRAMASDQVALMRRLGFERFHVIGHDRGGRTAHRMALDYPEIVLSLAVLDIVPTRTMFEGVNREIASVYWHWYFLCQPEPFPERLIAADPDYFYETCLVGWGGGRIEDFDHAMLNAYRTAWRDHRMIHGSCSDYRATATIDLALDAADMHRTIDCPTLVLFGSEGPMARIFDIQEEWRKICSRVDAGSLPGGHYFVDHFPQETSAILMEFLSQQ